MPVQGRENIHFPSASWCAHSISEIERCHMDDEFYNGTRRVYFFQDQVQTGLYLALVFSQSSHKGCHFPSYYRLSLEVTSFIYSYSFGDPNSFYLT